MAAKNIASIGEKKFKTLQEAVTAAQKNETIVLIDNTTENVTVTEDKVITIDLNGKVLSGGTDTDPEHKDKAAILNNGTTTIKDSSDPSTGMVKRDDEGPGSYYVIDNQGIMTIESGTIFNNSSNDSEKKGGSSLIRNGGAISPEKPYEPDYAKLYIKGGKMKQDNFIAVKNDEKGFVEMTGGIVESASESALQNWANAAASDGTINGLVWAFAYDQAGDSNTVLKDNITVNGKIWAENYDSESGKKAANVTINGGTYNLVGSEEGKPGPEFRTMNACGKIAISDGSFNVDPSEYLTTDAKVVRSEDGKFVTAKKNGIAIAIHPKYVTRSATDKPVFPEEMFITILEEQVNRKILPLFATCEVALFKDNKYYPVTVENFEEQIALASEGKELTVEADDEFGIKKLINFISSAISDDAFKVVKNEEVHVGIIYGNCDEVVDHDKLGIEAVNANGYWMTFKFDLTAAEAEGYSELKLRGTDVPIVDGDNFVNITNPGTVISITGKLTKKEITGSVEEALDNKLVFRAHSLDLDPRA